MLIRLLYVSRPAGPQTSHVTADILSSARRFNALHGIGGVLCQGQGLYLQQLEGERGAVNQLYARILGDRRHHDVQLLHLQEAEQRRYGEWSMAHVHLRDDDPMLLMKHPEFDPYSAPGEFMSRFIVELAASGNRIESPPP